MSCLHKYLKRIHLDSILDKEKIRIGTATYYANDNHGGKVKDMTEQNVTVSGISKDLSNCHGLRGMFSPLRHC